MDYLKVEIKHLNNDTKKNTRTGKWDNNRQKYLNIKMCLYPKLINNRKYTANKKMAGRSSRCSRP